MKFLVLGAGSMGYAATFDLIRSPKVEQVILADSDTERLRTVVHRLSDEKITPVELDFNKFDEVCELMSRSDVALSCVTAPLNYELTKAALKAGTHFCDLGGSEEVVGKQLALDELAKERDITIIPNLGLAPGLVSILAVAAADSLDELYEIRIRVGGVPVDPEGSLNYSHVCEMEGLIKQYTEDVTLIRDGKTFRLPPLNDLEKIEFPKPFGVMEAFSTAGGVADLPETYKGKVQHLDYKTIRYPGHCQHITMLKELGLLDDEPVTLSGGTKVVPRHLLTHLLDEKLPKDEPDAVLARVVVTGVKERKPLQIVWECIDYSDQAEGLSGMMRMNAFPGSIVAQMIARGDITERGVLRQERSVPVKLFLAELAGRGVTLTMNERAPVPHAV